jgi:hypothetical protein
MKYCKTLLLPLLLITILGLNSCVRDYICRCEITYSGQPGLPDTTVRTYPIRDTKKEARSLCEQNSFNSEDGEIKTVETCQLY